MSLKITKAIPIFAGSITIGNFLFSLIPFSSDRSNWYKLFLDAVSPEFRFIVFTLFTLVFSFTTVKLLTIIDRSEGMPSSKMFLTSLLSIIFSWIVVFNLRFITLDNDLAGWNLYIFIVTSWVFSVFHSIMLHSDFKSLDYPNYGRNEKDPVPFWALIDNGFYTPRYIRAIRVISFWLIFILGGLVYNF